MGFNQLLFKIHFLAFSLNLRFYFQFKCHNCTVDTATKVVIMLKYNKISTKEKMLYLSSAFIKCHLKEEFNSVYILSRLPME